VPHERPPSPSRRLRAALAPLTEVIVPGAAVGAGYLMMGSHWEVFKTWLAGLGIAPEISTFGAPVVVIAAIVGLRRALRPAPNEVDEPGSTA
jgi:formate hydrogenlyase subunit 3/multisubunit Na+/H+ antiporter MnhD subunit